MNSDATGSDDPEFTVKGADGQDGQKLLKARGNHFSRRTVRHGEDDDPMGGCLREPQNMAEVAVRGDKGSTLGTADSEDAFVGFAREALVPDPHDVMTGRSQELDFSEAEILVDLELHGAVFVGTGMMFSRAASAP